MNLYNDIVIFVDEIKDDFDSLVNLNIIIEKIKYYLNEQNYLDKINSNKDHIKILEKKIFNSYVQLKQEL